MSAEKLAHFITDWIFDISLCENSINRCTRYIYIYVYMCVCRYGQHFQQSKDQLDLVANSAHGQLDKENCFFPVPVRARNLLPWDGLGRSVPRQPAHSLYSGWIWRLLMRFLPLSATPFIDTANRYGSVPNLSGHACPVLWTCQLSIAVIYYLARATTSHLGVDCTCVQEVCECIVGVGYRFHKELDWLK